MKEQRKKQNKRAGETADVFENRSKKLRNRETNLISFVFVGLFLLMMGYLVYFNIYISPNVINSPYNKRIYTEPDIAVRRGTIFSADGAVLATTTLDDSGNEVRTYPFKNIFSQTVGMSRGGGSGIEGAASDSLTTSTSKTDVAETSSSVTGEEYQGDNVYTTLDENLQKLASDAMGDNKGAVVIMDPTTGKILAMVSKPDYDPNLASTDYSTWLSYSSSDSVLLNRATQGLYPPGSTFKILTALEYIREHPNDYGDFSYKCTGSTSVEGGTVVNCIDNEKHGTQNLKQSFANSCNCAFSTIGLMLDKAQYRSTVESFGLNSKLPLDDIESSTSLFKLDVGSTISETQETAFGQGDTMITPMQNLLITAAIANNGVMMKPYLIDHVESADGTLVSQTTPEEYRTVATSSEASLIGGFMRSVVTSGTGQLFSDSSYHFACKTGTAQYSNSGSLSHAWVTGYAPYESPKIAITVILESNFKDSTNAQLVAKQILDSYFGSK